MKAGACMQIESGQVFLDMLEREQVSSDDVFALKNVTQQDALALIQAFKSGKCPSGLIFEMTTSQEIDAAVLNELFLSAPAKTRFHFKNISFNKNAFTGLAEALTKGEGPNNLEFKFEQCKFEDTQLIAKAMVSPKCTKGFEWDFDDSNQVQQGVHEIKAAVSETMADRAISNIKSYEVQSHETYNYSGSDYQYLQKSYQSAINEWPEAADKKRVLAKFLAFLTEKKGKLGIDEMSRVLTYAYAQLNNLFELGEDTAELKIIYNKLRCDLASRYLETARHILRNNSSSSLVADFYIRALEHYALVLGTFEPESYDDVGHFMDVLKKFDPQGVRLGYLQVESLLTILEDIEKTTQYRERFKLDTQSFFRARCHIFKSQSNDNPVAAIVNLMKMFVDPNIAHDLDSQQTIIFNIKEIAEAKRCQLTEKQLDVIWQQVMKLQHKLFGFNLDRMRRVQEFLVQQYTALTTTTAKIRLNLMKDNSSNSSIPTSQLQKICADPSSKSSLMALDRYTIETLYQFIKSKEGRYESAALKNVEAAYLAILMKQPKDILIGDEQADKIAIDFLKKMVAQGSIEASCLLLFAKIATAKKLGMPLLISFSALTKNQKLELTLFPLLEQLLQTFAADVIATDKSNSSLWVSLSASFYDILSVVAELANKQKCLEQAKTLADSLFDQAELLEWQSGEWQAKHKKECLKLSVLLGSDKFFKKLQDSAYQSKCPEKDFELLQELGKLTWTNQLPSSVVVALTDTCSRMIARYPQYFVKFVSENFDVLFPRLKKILESKTEQDKIHLFQALWPEVSKSTSAKIKKEVFSLIEEVLLKTKAEDIRQFAILAVIAAIPVMGSDAIILQQLITVFQKIEETHTKEAIFFYDYVAAYHEHQASQHKALNKQQKEIFEAIGWYEKAFEHSDQMQQGKIAIAVVALIQKYDLSQVSGASDMIECWLKRYQLVKVEDKRIPHQLFHAMAKRIAGYSLNDALVLPVHYFLLAYDCAEDDVTKNQVTQDYIAYLESCSDRHTISLSYIPNQSTHQRMFEEQAKAKSPKALKFMAAYPKLFSQEQSEQVVPELIDCYLVEGAKGNILFNVTEALSYFERVRNSQTLSQETKNEYANKFIRHFVPTIKDELTATADSATKSGLAKLFSKKLSTPVLDTLSLIVAGAKDVKDENIAKEIAQIAERIPNGNPYKNRFERLADALGYKKPEVIQSEEQSKNGVENSALEANVVSSAPVIPREGAESSRSSIDSQRDDNEKISSLNLSRKSSESLLGAALGKSDLALPNNEATNIVESTKVILQQQITETDAKVSKVPENNPTVFEQKKVNIVTIPQEKVKGIFGEDESSDEEEKVISQLQTSKNEDLNPTKELSTQERENFSEKLFSFEDELSVTKKVDESPKQEDLFTQDFLALTKVKETEKKEEIVTTPISTETEVLEKEIVETSVTEKNKKQAPLSPIPNSEEKSKSTTVTTPTIPLKEEKSIGIFGSDDEDEKTSDTSVDTHEERRSSADSKSFVKDLFEWEHNGLFKKEEDVTDNFFSSFNYKKGTNRSPVSSPEAKKSQDFTVKQKKDSPVIEPLQKEKQEKQPATITAEIVKKQETGQRQDTPPLQKTQNTNVPVTKQQESVKQEVIKKENKQDTVAPTVSTTTDTAAPAPSVFQRFWQWLKRLFTRKTPNSNEQILPPTTHKVEQKITPVVTKITTEQEQQRLVLEQDIKDVYKKIANNSLPLDKVTTKNYFVEPLAKLNKVYNALGKQPDKEMATIIDEMHGRIELAGTRASGLKPEERIAQGIEYIRRADRVEGYAYLLQKLGADDLTIEIDGSNIKQARLPVEDKSRNALIVECVHKIVANAQPARGTEKKALQIAINAIYKNFALFNDNEQSQPMWQKLKAIEGSKKSWLMWSTTTDYKNLSSILFIKNSNDQHVPAKSSIKTPTK